MEVNPQEVKVACVIAVVLARVEGVEGSDPHDWISLPLPTPHTCYNQRVTTKSAWQCLCFLQIGKKYLCALKSKWWSSIGKDQCVILGFYGVNFWQNHWQLVSAAGWKFTWPHASWLSASGPNAGSTS